jgi:hypothetical protein
VKRLALLLSCVVVISACKKDAPPPPEATSKSPDSAAPTKRVVGPLSEADAAALGTMNDRLQTYFDIHKKLEAELPKVPDNATPQEIDKRQRLFEQKIREARKGAKQGDIFTPESQAVIKRLLVAVFDGPEGKALKDTVLDENPAGMNLTVNMRYPDTVPVSTMPPEVLQTLPKLAEDMEYRFVGRHLILLDAHAHVIADFVPNAIPE